ncbi:MAG TPA: 50S ribosomal protein L5, partial [Bacillota bacterium]|nr:50S ribosomal protein L5 [Bacillota bacterium]
MNRLQEKYRSAIVPAMVEKFNYTSVMQAPKISKIVVNIGAGDAVQNPKVLDDA